MCGYVQGDAGENPEERYSIFSDGLERLLAKKGPGARCVSGARTTHSSLHTTRFVMGRAMCAGAEPRVYVSLELASK